MLKLSLVTRFKLHRGTTENLSFEVLDELDTQIETNKKLSLLALKYACDDLSVNYVVSARKILLFADMIYPEIVNSNLYLELDKSIDLSTPLAAEYYNGPSAVCSIPPDDAILINTECI